MDSRVRHGNDKKERHGGDKKERHGGDKKERHGGDKKERHGNDRRWVVMPSRVIIRILHTVKYEHPFHGVIRYPSSQSVMPDVIRHPCGFGGKEWIPVSGTGMTGRESHAAL
ncbi:MAG: hypothetical protein ISR54_07345 [Chlorobium phaeobacteroides]|uniref:Alpha-2-HS-glycoprotein n=1 Tax=Chlorobium phaeobacteroides (strain BS1) TaxID=331678 RepID=B3EMF3_CHLPB|nr:hypothetical protein [Chlorobium phaeobacteroides]